MLLRVAERDAAALRALVAATDVPDEIFGFHVQQAVEKCLKARIALRGVVYPLTHNVDELLQLLARQDINVEGLRGLTDYTPYAVEFRYQGLDPRTDSIDRAGGLMLVEEVLEEARRELSEAESA